ncbi:MAG: hypothetical protein ACR2N2_11900 [Acidimicrobiia bacterium]
MTIAAVDIGSNSVRLLVRDGNGLELARCVEVTSLARGVDASGRLAADRIAATMLVLGDYRRIMDLHRVDDGAAVATSAVRDASNGLDLIASAAGILGFAPQVISGDREAELSFSGAAAGIEDETVVVDIGGGSTEVIVGSNGTSEWSHSYDIGSVRLTDRCIHDRPVSGEVMSEAIAEVRSVLSNPDVRNPGGDVIGVAGTFTSLAAIHLGLETYDRSAVDGTELTAHDLGGLVEHLSKMTLHQTESIPSLEPKRAPVILGGAIIASETIAALGAGAVRISERDLLDGIADALDNA